MVTNQQLSVMSLEDVSTLVKENPEDERYRLFKYYLELTTLLDQKFQPLTKGSDPDRWQDGKWNEKTFQSILKFMKELNKWQKNVSYMSEEARTNAGISNDIYPLYFSDYLRNIQYCLQKKDFSSLSKEVMSFSMKRFEESDLGAMSQIPIETNSMDTIHFSDEDINDEHISVTYRIVTFVVDSQTYIFELDIASAVKLKIKLQARMDRQGLLKLLRDEQLTHYIDGVKQSANRVSDAFTKLKEKLAFSIDSIHFSDSQGLFGARYSTVTVVIDSRSYTFQLGTRSTEKFKKKLQSNMDRQRLRELIDEQLTHYIDGVKQPEGVESASFKNLKEKLAGEQSQDRESSNFTLITKPLKHQSFEDIHASWLSDLSQSGYCANPYLLTTFDLTSFAESNSLSGNEHNLDLYRGIFGHEHDKLFYLAVNLEKIYTAKSFSEELGVTMPMFEQIKRMSHGISALDEKVNAMFLGMTTIRTNTKGRTVFDQQDKLVWESAYIVYPALNKSDAGVFTTRVTIAPDGSVDTSWFAHTPDPAKNKNTVWRGFGNALQWIHQKYTLYGSLDEVIPESLLLQKNKVIQYRQLAKMSKEEVSDLIKDDPTNEDYQLFLDYLDLTEKLDQKFQPLDGEPVQSKWSDDGFLSILNFMREIKDFKASVEGLPDAKIIGGKIEPELYFSNYLRNIQLCLKRQDFTRLLDGVKDFTLSHQLSRIGRFTLLGPISPPPDTGGEEIEEFDKQNTSLLKQTSQKGLCLKPACYTSYKNLDFVREDKRTHNNANFDKFIGDYKRSWWGMPNEGLDADVERKLVSMKTYDSLTAQMKKAVNIAVQDSTANDCILLKRFLNNDEPRTPEVAYNNQSYFDKDGNLIVKNIVCYYPSLDKSDAVVVTDCYTFDNSGSLTLDSVVHIPNTSDTAWKGLASFYGSLKDANSIEDVYEQLSLGSGLSPTLQP